MIQNIIKDAYLILSEEFSLELQSTLLHATMHHANKLQDLVLEITFFAISIMKTGSLLFSHEQISEYEKTKFIIMKEDRI